MAIVKKKFISGIIISSDSITKFNLSLSANPSADRTVTIPDATTTLLGHDTVQTVTSKTIVVANNTITTAASGDLSSTELNAALAEIQTDISDHKSDATDAHDASAISVVPTGNLAASDTQAALVELQTDVDTANTNHSDHLSDTVDAHDASAISVVPTGNLTSSTVQAALEELQTEITGAGGDLNTHLNDTTDAHDASAISNVPAGNIVATDIQAAINELDSEKVAGPGSSVDNTIVRFDSTTGKLIQGSGVTVDDSDNVVIPGDLQVDGNVVDLSEGTSVDIGTTSTATTVNIGTGSGANIINLGGATTTVNINGTVNNQNVTNLDVDDKLITINKGGAGSSGGVAGLEIEEGGSITGYAETSGDRLSWKFKAPASAGIATLTPGSSNDDVVLEDAAQTLSQKTLTSPVLNTPTTDINIWDDQASTPANPSAGFYKTYFKSDGKFYKLNSAGVEVEIGSGTGGGATTITVTAGEGLLVNDAVYVSIGTSDSGRTAGRAYKLDATNDLRIEFIGFVTVAAIAGNPVTIQVAGELTGFTGLTAGKPLFASVTTPGSYQATSPNAINQWMIQLGLASSTTSVTVNAAGSATAIKITPDAQTTETAVNYITNPGAEGNTVAGWVVSKNTSANAVPDSGFVTSGTNITWLASSSNPLRGSYSFELTKDAANRLGEQVHFPFTIQNADKNKVLQISFDYAVSTNFADGDLVLWLYDVTNNTFIQPAPYRILKHTLTAERLGLEFQTSSSSSYRLLIHVASTSALAYTAKFDNFNVGPQAKLYGSPVTDWVSWTPTGSWSSNTTYTGFWRRVGDTVELDIQVATSGVPTSTVLTINPPSFAAVDTAKLVDSGGLFSPLGHGHANDSDSQAYPLWVDYTSNTFRILIENSASTYGNNAGLTQAVPFTFGSGDDVKVLIKYPVSGWSSSVLMSSDADTRVVAARCETAGVVAISTTQPVNFATKTIDTHGAVTTGSSWKFTAPVPGYYRIAATVDLDAGTSIGLYKNGSLYSNLTEVSNGSLIESGSDIISLVAGDYIDIRTTSGSTNTSATTTNTHIAIDRISGPAQIAASETVSFSANTSTTAATTSTPFIYTIEDHDSHGAYSTSTGVFTAPISGTYFFHSIGYYGASAAYSTIRKNGSNIVAQGMQTVGNSEVNAVSHLLRLVAGDTVEIRPSGSVTANGNAATNTFIGYRIGN